MQSRRIEQLVFDNFLLTRKILSKNPEYRDSVMKYYIMIDKIKFRLSKEDYKLVDEALEARSEMECIQGYETFMTGLLMGTQLAEKDK